MPDISNIIVWLILGVVSGWVASKIMKRDSEMGFWMNLIVGVVGAFIGGWVAGIFGLGPATGLNVWSFIISIVGAVILLGIISMFKRKL